MSGSKIAVAAVWFVVVASALHAGLSMGTVSTMHSGTGEPFPPPNAAIGIVCFGLMASSVGVFLIRRHIRFGHTWTTRLVDLIFGDGTWETVVVRLKPAALMIVATYIQGVVGLISTYANAQSWTSYVNSAFALSVGIGLTIAYGLSRRFPPLLF
jgi:hypothetical protein